MRTANLPLRKSALRKPARCDTVLSTYLPRLSLVRVMRIMGRFFYALVVRQAEGQVAA